MSRRQKYFENNQLQRAYSNERQYEDFEKFVNAKMPLYKIQLKLESRKWTISLKISQNTYRFKTTIQMKHSM